MRKLFLAALILLLAAQAYAIGLAPARSTFAYTPGKSEGTFRIIAEEVPLKVMITTDGELGKYITLEKEVLTLDQQETYIKFAIDLPDEMPPGERSGGIMVIEIPQGVNKETAVVAAPAVIHQVRVNVPYPGKYVLGKVFTTTSDLSAPVVFTVGMSNYGKEDISSARASIIIKGPTNQEIATVKTDPVGIGAGQEQKVTASWTAANAGTYLIETIIEYDGHTLKLSDTFDVGNADVEIESLSMGDFKPGQIAKLDVSLWNRWNKPINVQGKVDVFKGSTLVSTFNTMPVDIPELSHGIMTAYWNTEGISLGEYTIVAKATYNSRTAEKSFSTMISSSGAKVSDLTTGKVTAKEGGNNTMLIILVAALIIINIVLFIFVAKKMRKTS